MIRLNDGAWLVETVQDLPDLKGNDLFLDVETAALTAGIPGDPDDDGVIRKKYQGVYPYKGDRVCGLAAAMDDSDIFYVPTRHTPSLQGRNLPVENVARWTSDLMSRCHQWVNHNIIFDASFLHFDGVQLADRMVDTLTLAKLIDSDRQGHGLKQLSIDWLGMDNDDELMIKSYLKGIKSKNYADIPIDMLGTYACTDIRMNRRLFYEKLVCPDGMERVWENEILLTPVLYDMEMEGICIDPEECRRESYKSLKQMIESATRIQEISDREWTNSSACVYDILCTQFGLPVLKTKQEKDKDGKYYDTGRPTFDKHVLPMYSIHPDVIGKPDLVELLEHIQLYRTESQFKSTFLDAFLELRDDDNRVHPSYNQVVRTGRMSSKRPNSQQQNSRSKALVHPGDGNGFISCDYSQVEYRLIAHYIEDPDVIAAYQNDKTTDFHQWVADLIHVDRKAGKTLNFAMAYGAGKRKVTSSLVSNAMIMKEIGEEVDQMVARGEVAQDRTNRVFLELCKQRANEVYNRYHERIPGIKATADFAKKVCEQRGYVFNAYGRRRHLPWKFARKAFNSLIQGCAMDIMKERMIALAPRYNKKTRDLNLRVAWNVHDEIGFEGPWEVCQDKETQLWIKNTLETPDVKFSVPVFTDMGISNKNWSIAASDKTKQALAETW